jgi:hypothetical protein
MFIKLGLPAFFLLSPLLVLATACKPSHSDTPPKELENFIDERTFSIVSVNQSTKAGVAGTGWIVNKVDDSNNYEY